VIPVVPYLNLEMMGVRLPFVSLTKNHTNMKQTTCIPAAVTKKPVGVITLKNIFVNVANNAVKLMFTKATIGIPLEGRISDEYIQSPGPSVALKRIKKMTQPMIVWTVQSK